MTQSLLDRADSARRPFNAWFWIALAALVVLVGVAFFALTRRPPEERSASPEQTPPATPAVAAPAVPTNRSPARAPAPVVPAPSRQPAAAPTAPPRPVPSSPATPPPAAPVIAPRPVSAPVPVPAPAPAPAPQPPRPSPAAPPAGTPTVNHRAALDEAKALLGQDRPGDARERLEALLAAPLDPASRTEAEELLGQAFIALVLTPRPMREKTDYTVQPGDSLEKIARKNGTTVELIRKGNQLAGSMIRADQRLRILNGSFRATVDKSDNTLTLFLNDRFFKRYRVGTGQYSKTPTGSFKVTDKIAQPTWWRPDGKSIPYGDPENLLGTHWLALDVRGYGIHGTWEPDTIGKQASAGCVRLLNEDVEQLFTLLPIGTPVTIEE